MSSSSAQWLQKFAGSVAPQSAIQPISGKSNPFRQSGSSQSQYHSEDAEMGANQPYHSARFLGYFRNQAIYVGGRLNLSC